MEKINLTAPEPKPSTDTERLATSAPRRPPAGRLLLFVRRTHLYLGLLLVPWVLLFGVSGFLFNHTGTTFGGATRELAQFSSADVRRLTQFEPLDLHKLAADVVRQINQAAKDGPGKYQLVDASAHVTANAGFSGRTTNGNINVSLNLAEGAASLTALAGNPPAKQTKPAFADQQVQLAGLDFAALGEKAGVLVKAAGLTVDGAMTPRARSGPELRFVVQDEQGRRWNTTCDLAQGRLSGRAADDDNGLNFYSAVTRLHKTHHYPDRVGGRWFWVLVADITALTLVFWGVSGLLMWWQLKPTRVLGVLGLSFAAGLAFIIFSGALDDLTFGAPRARPDGGPAFDGEAGGERGGPGQRGPGGMRRAGGGRGEGSSANGAPGDGGNRASGDK